MKIGDQPAFAGSQMTNRDAELSGLTKREWFAAHAPEIPTWYRKGLDDSSAEPGRFFSWRWFYADEMLKKRGSNEPQHTR